MKNKLKLDIAFVRAVMQYAHDLAGGESRDLSPDEQRGWDEGIAFIADAERQIARHEEIERLAAIDTHTEPGDNRPGFNTSRGTDPESVDHRSTPTQLRDAVLSSLEGQVEDPDNMAHVRSVLTRHLTSHATRDDREWAAGLVTRAGETYTSAWAKYITGRHIELTNEERAALQVGSNTAGGYLLPTHLDPTIILQNAGTSNVIRQMSRVVTLPAGYTAWNGVTSAGVTASWDGELVEVSDDTPTFGRKSIATNIAQAFVQASIAATEDIAGLSTDVLMLMADARDRLEGAAHATGSGSGQPMGVFTAVHAVTAQRVQSTTAATIGLVDINAVYLKPPIRYRGKGSWLTNPLYAVAVKGLGTAVSASYSGDLREPVSTRWLDKPVFESDDAPTAQTTTALDDEILYGDFSQYVIVDKPGGMSVEYIPHLFNTANNLPDGRRGWFAYWRTGGDVVTTSAFGLLVDKTSA